jgi:hypothetical protein
MQCASITLWTIDSLWLRHPSAFEQSGCWTAERPSHKLSPGNPATAVNPLESFFSFIMTVAIVFKPVSSRYIGGFFTRMPSALASS